MPPETTPENKRDIKVETTIEDEHVEIAGVIDKSLNHLAQDDPLLVEAVRERYLIKPSREPYNWGKAGKAPEGRNLNGQFRQGSSKLIGERV